VLWNCCVSESWSHEVLRALWAAEEDATLKRVRGRIAKDEAVHARFGWIYLDWLADDLEEAERAVLRRAAARAVRTLEKGLTTTEQLPEESFDPVAPLGGMGQAGYHAVARRALEERVRRPLADRGFL
jgi:phytoene/squalene synthetase